MTTVPQTLLTLLLLLLLLMLRDVYHLHVEREMFDVDSARRLEYCRRYPQQLSVVRYDGHRFSVFFQSSVCTAPYETQRARSQRCGHFYIADVITSFPAVGVRRTAISLYVCLSVCPSVSLSVRSHILKSTRPNFLYMLAYVAWWLSGRTLNLRFTGRGFNSRPVRFHVK